MARAIDGAFVRQCVAAVLVGGLLGGFFGLASAQQDSSGGLNTECAGRCAANGYTAEFCGQVCWVQDPALIAAGNTLDWKCVGKCSERGDKARDCMAKCRIY